MTVLTQVSVVAPPQPAAVPRSVQLLTVADGRPTVSLVFWQPPAPAAQR